MPRRPVHEATLTVPLRGHQHFWSTMRDLGRFTTADIHGSSNANKACVQDFMRRLVKAGIIAEAGRQDTTGDMIFAIVKDLGPEAPAVRRDGSLAQRPGVGNEQMWRAMKMLSTFTARELAIAASTDDVTVKERTAGAYITHLHRVGYLSLAAAATHKGQAQYRLIKRTGPLAPMIQRTSFVWDPNLREVVGKGTDR